MCILIIHRINDHFSCHFGFLDDGSLTSVYVQIVTNCILWFCNCTMLTRRPFGAMVKLKRRVSECAAPLSLSLSLSSGLHLYFLLQIFDSLTRQVLDLTDEEENLVDKAPFLQKKKK